MSEPAPHATDTDTDTDDEETPASFGPGSPLANLRQRREAIAAAQVEDLPVPRWEDPVIVVRYRPGDHAVARRCMDRVEKAPKKDRARVEVEANADFLVHACVGVYARIGGQPHACTGPDEWTPIDPDTWDGWDRFSPHLGVTLGAATESARSVVQALFFTDGDLISAAGHIMSWSGYKETEADDQLTGE